MNSGLVILLAVVAIALGVSAYKLPKLRSGLAAAALAVAGLAAFVVALLSAKGDVKAAVRQVKVKREVKQAVSDHKEAMEEEKSAVDEAQEELEKIVETGEETPDLQELADSFNDKFANL